MICRVFNLPTELQRKNNFENVGISLHAEFCTLNLLYTIIYLYAVFQANILTRHKVAMLRNPNEID